ncbi:MAG: hypothetical protein MMC23_001572 [Stictis urceolatum]|nr:hypothetical protein [Stictis urceolata]
MKVLCLAWYSYIKPQAIADSRSWQGLGRTGTNSLREALIELGYYDVYHYAAVLQVSPKDAEMWNEAFEGKFGSGKKQYAKEDWDKLVGHCMAVTDAPCNLFAEELLAAYPDAQVILTTRDSPAQWYESVQRTLLPFVKFLDDQSLVPRFMKAWGPDHPASLMTMIGWAKKLYEEHSDHIREVVQEENLLEFNVKQGWRPLCVFLEKSVPEKPFPRVNYKEQRDKHTGENAQIAMQTALWNLSKAVVGMTGSAVALGLGIFFAWKPRSR